MVVSRGRKLFLPLSYEVLLDGALGQQHRAMTTLKAAETRRGKILAAGSSSVACRLKQRGHAMQAVLYGRTFYCSQMWPLARGV